MAADDDGIIKRTIDDGNVFGGEGLTTHVSSPDGSGSESISTQYRGRDEVYAGSSSYDDSAGISGQLQGRPTGTQGQETRTGSILRERLHRDGRGPWKPVEWLEAGTREPVDVIAYPESGDGPPLEIQVTMPDAQEVLRSLGQNPDEPLPLPNEDPGAYRNLLMAAIEHKRFASDPRMVLALDATRSPGFVHRAVVDKFREDRGAWAARVGYQEVWVVGPQPDMTYRLDTPDTD